jgi:plasmid stabilization system protein ParE
MGDIHSNATCWPTRMPLPHDGHSWMKRIGFMGTIVASGGFLAGSFSGVSSMPRGDKSSYTDKQKRKAQHIKDGYVKRGVAKKEAAARAWATVNSESGGGEKSGSGRGKPENHAASRKGGRKGGAASAARPKTARSTAAKKAAATRRRHTS